MPVIPHLRRVLRATCARLVFAAALLGPGLSQAAPLPEFSADYGLHKGILKVAEANIQLRKQGERYLYRSYSKTVGMASLIRGDRITEQSTIEYHDDHVRPLEYLYRHEGSKKNRDTHLIFDWSLNKVSNITRGKNWTLKVPDGTLDRFSAQLAVMRALPIDGKELSYQIADNDGQVETHTYRILGTERVETPAGTFDTIKLQRVRSGSKRTTYFWCSSKHSYLPVRVEHVESNGSKFSMELEKLSKL